MPNGAATTGFELYFNFHHGVLERFDCEIQFENIVVLRFHQNHAKVCANTEVFALVADDKAFVIFLYFIYCKIDHLHNIQPNCI